MIDQTFQEFMMKLAARMATGNFNVKVICEGGVEFEARVTGYDENFQTIKVEFLSDNLSIEKFVRVEQPNGFGGMGMDIDDRDNSTLELRKVLIKEFNAYMSNIKLD